MAVDDLGDDVGNVCHRLDVVELGSFDERGAGRPVLSASIGTCEQRIFPIEGYRPDGTLDGVGVDLDAAVIDEAGEPQRDSV